MLAAQATRREEAAEALAPLVTAEVVAQAAARVPDLWLHDEPGFHTAQAVRDAYVDHFVRRVTARPVWQP